MTDIFWSSHFEKELYYLSWEGLSGVADQWTVLFRLLRAFDAQARVFGAVTGTIRIVRESVDQEWPVDTNAAVLHERVKSLAELPKLLEGTLRCEPLLWLPDDHLEVVDYDDMDMYRLGPATLSPVIGDPVGPPGLQPWRLRGAPVDLLTVDFFCGVDATGLGLWVRSGGDLWLPKRLDGEPNLPHGEVNAALLAHAVEEIAAATGAKIAQRPPG